MSSTAAPQPAPPPPRQTDFRRRAVLPSTQRNVGQGAAGGLDLSSDEYLDRIEEELNRRVDHDTLSLVDGMRDLVALAALDPSNPPHPSASSHRALSSQLKTEHMLRSAQSLLALAHTLKLLHLFGDGEAGHVAREGRDKELIDDIDRLKERVRELAGEQGGLDGAAGA
ncbi:hypothetical protein JCM3775_002215 [Rhodotorula graminis]